MSLTCLSGPQQDGPPDQHFFSEHAASMPQQPGFAASYGSQRQQQEQHDPAWGTLIHVAVPPVAPSTAELELGVQMPVHLHVRRPVAATAMILSGSAGQPPPPDAWQVRVRAYPSAWGLLSNAYLPATCKL